MKETTKLLIMLVTLAIILTLSVAMLRLNDYYLKREQDVKLFCVEQKAKHKFCRKYF